MKQITIEQRVSLNEEWEKSFDIIAFNSFAFLPSMKQAIDARFHVFQSLHGSIVSLNNLRRSVEAATAKTFLHLGEEIKVARRQVWRIWRVLQDFPVSVVEEFNHCLLAWCRGIVMQ